MIENEYRHNKRFRDYVDKYAAKHGITVEEAMKRAEERAVKAESRYFKAA